MPQHRQRHTAHQCCLWSPHVLPCTSGRVPVRSSFLASALPGANWRPRGAEARVSNHCAELAEPARAQRARKARRASNAPVRAARAARPELTPEAARPRHRCLARPRRTLASMTVFIASSRTSPSNQPGVTSASGSARASCWAALGVRAAAIRARIAASVVFCAWKACSAVGYETPSSTTGVRAKELRNLCAPSKCTMASSPYCARSCGKSSSAMLPGRTPGGGASEMRC